MLLARNLCFRKWTEIPKASPVSSYWKLLQFATQLASTPYRINSVTAIQTRQMQVITISTPTAINFVRIWKKTQARSQDVILTQIAAPTYVTRVTSHCLKNKAYNKRTVAHQAAQVTKHLTSWQPLLRSILAFTSLQRPALLSVTIWKPPHYYYYSPAPHFKSFQVCLICCPKRPSFGTIQSHAANVIFY